ncbi:MAG: acyltransferase [Clostridia bacterium]|nr:acyltransferase [Clostridia bacterium]
MSVQASSDNALPKERLRLTELSYLNVLFTLMVICIHIMSEPISTLDKSSLQYFAVFAPWKLFQFVTQAFVFLSGVKLFIKAGDGIDVRKFYIGRIKRVILPYLAWVIVYYLYFVGIGWYSFSLSELLHYMIFGDLASHFYFVIIICQFYLLTPLFARIFKRCSPWILSVYALFISLIFGEFLPQILGFISPKLAFTYNDRLFTTYLFYFVIGAAVGTNYKEVIDRLRKAKITVYSMFIFFTVLNLVLSYLTYSGKVYIHWIYTLHFAYSVSAIAAFLTFAAGFTVKRPTLPKAVKLADASSYMLYLSHILIIFAGRYFIIDRITTDIGVRFVITLAILAVYTVVSTAVWSFVKAKMRRTRK